MMKRALCFLTAAVLLLLPWIAPAEEDDECPFCGSGDTDGNHCYTCDEDF